MSGFSFGTTKPNEAAATTTSGFTGFSFGSPAFTVGTTTQSSNAPLSFGFGTTSSQPQPVSTLGSTMSPFSFGVKPAATSSQAPAMSSTNTTAPFSFSSLPGSTATTAPVLGTGFTFGVSSTKPAVSTSLSQPVSTIASTTGISFATPAMTSATITSSTSGLTGSTTTAAAPLGFSFPGSTQLQSGLPFGSATSSSKPSGFQPVLSTSTTSGLPTFGSTSVSSGSSVNVPTVPLTSTAVCTVTTPFTAAATTTTTSAPLSFTASSLTSITTSSVTSSNVISPSTVTQSVKSAMTYQQLEDAVNKWAHDLEEQERYFLDQADRITEWDDTLLKNSEKISTLYERVTECKSEQARLVQELDFIEGQQRELEQLLEPIERSASELPPGHSHSDFEREAILQLASNVDLELGQMLTDLRELADQVNSAQSRMSEVNGSDASLKADDDKSLKKLISSSSQAGSLQQVTRILNCHMHSLNWIHQNTQELMERVKILNET